MEKISTDPTQITQAAHLFLQPGSVTELRVPNSRQATVSGYFDNADELAKAIAHLDETTPPGIYVTVNPVRPDLLARARNRTLTYAKHTTADTDIDRRCWLLIDLDPVRPAGVSSTDAEHRAALDLARDVRAFLLELGFPTGSIISADSGNGAHLLVRIDLPNGREVSVSPRKSLTG